MLRIDAAFATHHLYRWEQEAIAYDYLEANDFLFLNYAQENPDTLLILTGDHETDELCVNGSVEKDNVHFVFTSQHHTGIGVPVYAIGPGASEFTGFYENTDIFHRITGFFE